MRPRFHPRLVNDPLGDPGLFVPLAYEKRALLFDIGRIDTLSPRDILRISHVFVTHTHMDHFCGLDHLLRIGLGRAKTLYIFGPQGFLSHIAGKLRAYNWNLAPSYSEAFIMVATEVRHDGLRRQVYDSRDGFRPRTPPQRLPPRRHLVKEPSLSVQTVILDHGIPCLGFRLEERFHINILKQELTALALATGPWIQQFKQALYDRAPPEQVIFAPRRDRDGEFVACRLDDLRSRIARITPGQIVAYISDVAYHADNARRIEMLARRADHLFIESAFLDEDRDRAQAKKHLTAGQAGRMAGRAGARRVTVFHFSPRYEGQTRQFAIQVRRAYRQARAACGDAPQDRRRAPGAAPGRES